MSTTTPYDPLDTVGQFVRAAIDRARDNGGTGDVLFSHGATVLSGADMLAVVERCQIAEARLANAKREAEDWVKAALGQPGDLAYTQAGSTASAILQKLTENPGILRSSDDLPDERPLFTTRQLFKALEGRVAAVERTVGISGDAVRLGGYPVTLAVDPDMPPGALEARSGESVARLTNMAGDDA